MQNLDIRLDLYLLMNLEILQIPEILKSLENLLILDDQQNQ